MFAIFETGGKQYRAEVGTVLQIEKLTNEEKEAVVFNRVYLVENEGNTTIGAPFVAGASVAAEIVTHGRGDKIRVVKFKPKKRSKTVHGHRQHFTKIKITNIAAA